MSRRHRWLVEHTIYHVIEDLVGMCHMVIDRVHQLFLGVHDYVWLVLLLLLVTLLVGCSEWSWEGRDSTFQWHRVGDIISRERSRDR